MQSLYVSASDGSYRLATALEIGESARRLREAFLTPGAILARVEEEVRMPEASPTLKLCAELLSLSEEWEAKHRLYDDRLPQNKMARMLHLPPVRLNNTDDGFVVDVPRKPKQRPLSPETVGQLRRALSVGVEPPAVVLELDPGGDVLLAPADATSAAAG